MALSPLGGGFFGGPCSLNHLFYATAPFSQVETPRLLAHGLQTPLTHAGWQAGRQSPAVEIDLARDEISPSTISPIFL